MATQAFDPATGEVLSDVAPSEMGPGLLDAVIRSHTERLSGVASPAEVQAMIADKDEEQILQAAAGQFSDVWFYEFEEGGKDVVGISALGARELRRIRADMGFPIRFPIQDIDLREAVQDGERGVACLLVGRDVRTGNEAPASVFVPYYKTLRKIDPDTKQPMRKFNPHARTVALGKCERNATLALVPKDHAIALLTERKRLAKENAPRLRSEARSAAVRTTQPSAAVATDGQYDPPPAETGAAPTAAAPASLAPVEVPPCPACGGKMWDNRATKRNPKAPDAKCRDRSCEGVVWKLEPAASDAVRLTDVPPGERELPLGGPAGGAPRPRTRDALANG